MLNFCRHAGLALVGASAALFGAGVVAAPIDYLATQGPKTDFTDPAPPSLSQSMNIAINNFLGTVNVLGLQTFESGSAEFEFDSGLGTGFVSGGAPKVINGNTVDAELGRYNMTPGLPTLPNGFADYGRWLEASASFTYAFDSEPLTAFSLFVTDLGDFDGTLTLDFLFGGETIYSKALVNTDGIEPTGTTNDTRSARPPAAPMSNGAGNGNLLFYGVTLDQVFDGVRFNINQATGSPTVDVLGFDQLVVGQARNGGGGGNVPEPMSIALVGMALLGLGATTRRRKA